MKPRFFSIFLGSFLALCAVLSAGTVRLYNDSPYQLKAVIRAADGTYLGEVVLLSQHTTQWSSGFDDYSSGPKSGYVEGPNVSQTPYTVEWSCMNGDSFSISVQVPQAGMTSALSGEGSRLCSQGNKKKQPKSSSENSNESQNKSS